MILSPAFKYRGSPRRHTVVSKVTWPRFPDFLRVYRVTAKGCTCGTYCTLCVCEGCLLWLLVKEPGFKVPLSRAWNFVGSRPFKFGRVRCTVVTHVEVPHVCALKSQGGPQKDKVAKRSQELSNSSNSSSDGSSDGEPLACAPLVKRELECGSKQCHRKIFLWSVYCEGCIWCLESEECAACKFNSLQPIIDTHLLPFSVCVLALRLVSHFSILKPTEAGPAHPWINDAHLRPGCGHPLSLPLCGSLWNASSAKS